MGLVSFLSRVPCLLPIAPLPPFLNSSRCPIHSGTISCKIEDNSSNEINGVRRRDVLNCFGAAISMELVASLSPIPFPFVEPANAADLIQRRQRSDFQSSIKSTLYESIKANQELIPPLLTLALNDIMTYDKATKSGGPNGSIRFSSEIDRPENKGLSVALSFVEEAKKEIDSYSKGGPISYSDIIQLAVMVFFLFNDYKSVLKFSSNSFDSGKSINDYPPPPTPTHLFDVAQSAAKATFLASATRKCGGNQEKGNLLYSAYGSSGQWGLFDKQFGRSDAQEPDPEGRVPDWTKASVQEMKDKFIAIGFGPRQLAVMSAFLGPDQLATEAKLATDPDVIKWVEKYQRSRETVSETDYEVDLITTLTKMSCLGQTINYEAYSYPVPKIDFTKLKL